MSASSSSETENEHRTPQFAPLSTKTAVRPLSRGVGSKSHKVAPKQKASPAKAARTIDPNRRLQCATARRSKCMEGSAKLFKYFTKSAGKPMGVRSPIVLELSDDDGSSYETPPDVRDRRERAAEAAKLDAHTRRYLDLTAEASDSETSGPDGSQQETPTMGGFVVSDGHLSDGESDDWADAGRAWRIASRKHGTPPREHTPKGKEEESDKELEVEEEEPEWDVGPPPSLPMDQPMTPVLLDSDVELEQQEEDSTDIECEMVRPDAPGVQLDNTTEGTRFRFNNQFVLLTYKTHLPKVQYIDWLKKETGREIKWIRLAHETAHQETPYLHTHVVVDFGKAVSTTSCHKFCYVNPNQPNVKDKCGRIHCHIRKLTSQQALQDAKVYISKEDKENQDLAAQKDDKVAKGAAMVERIQGASSVNVALRSNLRKLSDAAPIIQMFALRNLIPRDLEVPPRPTRPWAVEFLDQVENKDCPRDDRKIIWYVDPTGGTGKSHMAKYLSRVFRDESGYDWLCLSAINEPREAYQQLLQAIGNGFRMKGFLIDVARGFEYNKKLYTYLETIKNGMVTATKYSGAAIEMNTPWVVVMSNFYPQKIERGSVSPLPVFGINRYRADLVIP